MAERVHTPTDNVLTKHSFVLTITAAVVNGAGVDCLGYTRGKAVFDSSPSGAGTTSDCKVQESNDNGGGDPYGDVAGAAFAQATTAGGQKVQVMNLNLAKRKRWLRLVHTGVGAAAAGAAAGIVELYNPQNAPPIQDQAVISV